MCSLVRTLDHAVVLDDQEYGIEKGLMDPLRETRNEEVAFNSLFKNGIVIIERCFAVISITAKYN